MRPRHLIALCLGTCLLLGGSGLGAAWAAGGKSASWKVVRAALLRHPRLSLAAVARRLDLRTAGERLDGAAIQRLIDQHEGRQAIAKARDRALAEQLVARRKEMEGYSSLAQVARHLDGDLAGLRQHNLANLQDRHRDILDWLPRQFNAKSISRAAKRRIAAIALEEPSADDHQLARLFARDPQLRGLREWDAEQVAYLRRPSKIVPSEAKRRAVLIDGAIEILRGVSGASTLEQGAQKVAARYPGVNAQRLVVLGAQSQPLAREALRLLRPAGAGDAAGVRALLSKVTLKRVHLHERLARDLLSDEAAELPREVERKALSLAERAAYRKTSLSPREADKAKDPLLCAVLRAAHAELGRRTLSITKDLAPMLPILLAKVLNQGEKTQLGQRIVRDALTALVARHQLEVHGGRHSDSTFSDRLSLSWAEWERLRLALPEGVLDPPPRLSERHLEVVARLYAKVLAGSITSTEFYLRSRVSVDELKLLQAADPKRFPKPAETPGYRAIAGRRHLDQTTKLDLPALSRDWKGRVKPGIIGINQFRRDHGLSGKQMRYLRADEEAFPPPDALDRRRQARYVGRLARVFYGRDVLLKAADIAALISAHSGYRRRYGELSLSGYDNLRLVVVGEGYPNLKDIDAKNAVLVAEIATLQSNADHELEPVEIKRLMRARHKNFKPSRYDQLVKAGLIAKQQRSIVPKAQREKDARLLARLLVRSESSIAHVAETLHANGQERFSRAYAYRLRKEFEKTIFSAGELARLKRRHFRINETVVDLYALAMRLLPPGSGAKEVARAFNRLLSERELPAYDEEGLDAVETRFRARFGSLRRVHARRVAEVLREYAATADAKDSEAQIVARMLHDYPSINRTELARYKSLWIARPEDYPDARVFLRDGRLIVDKRAAGRAPNRKRFSGGWDVERALLAPAASDVTLAQELAAASHVAQLRYRMPLIDATLARYGRGNPLKGRNVLMVGHLLGTTVAMTRAILAAGASANNMTVVGSPYGSHPVVARALRGEGVDDVKIANLDPTAYEREVERAIDRMVRKHLSNHQPIVVLDDGGLVSHILAKRKYDQVRSAFRVVEQTAGGERLLEKKGVRSPTLSVAAALSKRFESIFIARTQSEKIEQAMQRAGLGRLRGKKVTIVGGGGLLGLRLAKTLRRKGCQVTIVESSKDARDGARRARFDRVYGVDDGERALALKNADLVVGVTGTPSLTLDDLRGLKNGAAFVSVSSKQVEFPMAQLAREARRQELARSPHLKLPNARYSWGRKHLIALGDGWPINFDGGVHSVPAQQIQLTRALMLAAAFQIAAVKGNHVAARGMHTLHESTDRWISSTFRKLLRRTKPISGEIDDPTRWADSLRDVARLIAQ